MGTSTFNLIKRGNKNFCGIFYAVASILSHNIAGGGGGRKKFETCEFQNF